MQTKKTITIHKPEDFEPMRKAGRLAASILDYITDFIKPGITTEEIDKLCGLRFQEDELAYLVSIRFFKPDFIEV